MPRGGPSLDSSDIAGCLHGSVVVVHPLSSALVIAPKKNIVRRMCPLSTKGLFGSPRHHHRCATRQAGPCCRQIHERKCMSPWVRGTGTYAPYSRLRESAIPIPAVCTATTGLHAGRSQSSENWQSFPSNQSRSMRAKSVALARAPDIRNARDSLAVEVLQTRPRRRRTAARTRDARLHRAASG